jgi:hypothetical protein
MEDEQQKFEYKVQYGTGIQSRIQKVHNALENGKSATHEFSNLIAYLTDEIKNPIKSELAKISEKYAIKVNNIRRMTVYPQTTYAWDAKHKCQYRSALINVEQSYAINEMTACIMNQLNEMGYLGYKQKQTQI